MRSTITSVAVAVTLMSAPGIAHAVPPCQVAYQHPVKAKVFGASLVQAFISCESPNTTTETGTVPSCQPATTYHQQAGSPPLGWLWGPKSRGTISMKAGKNALVGPDYPLNTDPEAVDLSMEIKIKDIRDNTGVANDTHGSVQIIARITLIDRVDDQLMTVLDFPLAFSAPVFRGMVTKKTSLSAILKAYSQPALPRCANVELVSMQVRDPNGNPFAVLGNYLP